MRNMYRLISLLLVLCLIVGDISITAFAESVLALPAAMEIIDEEAFYGAKSLDKVVLPNQVKEIRTRAFADSSVKTINLPSSLSFIADDAFNGTPLKNVTAVEGTYAYNWAVNHHYIIPKIPITIQSIRANVTTVEAGTPITWTVNAEGGVAPLSYNYAVFKDGLYQDSYSVSETEESVFVLTPTTGGYWSVLVTISDSLDTVASEISESVYVVDTTAYGEIELAITQNLNTYLIGDTIQVIVEKENTYGDVQYSFTAIDAAGNVLASQDASTNSSFSLVAFESGDITITGSVTDELGRSATTQRTIHVYSDEEIKPAAPASIQVNGDILPSESADSVLYPQRQFRISWERVSGADTYTLEIKKAEGADASILVSIDGLSELTYTLSPELFASIEQEALIQVAVSAQNRVIGDAAIGYFKVKTLQEQSQIYINGEASATWNEVYYAAARREFSILSDSDWTFTTDQDWIICSRDGDILSVYIKENLSAVNVLSGSITISNGVQNVQITITHGYLKKAPQLLTPSLPYDESTPSDLPYGDLYLKYSENGADTVTAKLYRRVNSEYIYVLEQSSQKDRMTLSIPDSIQTGDYCMLELIGYTAQAFPSKDKSATRTTAKYYFTLSNNNHYILIDGQTNRKIKIATKETVQIHASTVWSYAIDCDWLTLSTDNEPDETIILHALPNLESLQREGHITLYSGTSTATITVLQDTFVPYISYPSNLSQNQSSPTSIAFSAFPFVYNMTSKATLTKMSNSSVSTLSPDNGYVNIRQQTTIEKEELVANTTYKIELSNEYATTSYYIKTGSSSWGTTPYINLSDDTESEKSLIQWNVSAGQQSKQILLKSNGSWTITSNASWLAVSTSSGTSITSGKTITVSIQNNTSGEDRSGIITFKRSSSAEAVLYIEQVAADYIIVMNTDTLAPYNNNDMIQHVSGQENSFQLSVRTGCIWNVVSDSSWLTFDSSNSTMKTVAATSTKLKLYCSENPVGNQPRSAKLTFSSGNESFVLNVFQDACLETPKVTTSITSTNINNPSMVLYQDISFTWTPVPGAVKYDVSLMLPSSTYQQNYYFDEDGSSEYSFTIPHDWLAVDGNAYFFRVKSIDQQGYEYSGNRYCYTVIHDEKAVLNGSSTPTWKNATDYQATNTYTVISTASWTAAPQQSWIHVTPMTGESGDTLTVTLDNNTGAARNGTVNVTVNGNTTTLHVYQCAKLTDNPTVISPTFSTEPESPSIVAASDVSPLTVTWEVELQTDFYYLAIYSYGDKGFSNHVVETRNIKPEQAGSYTFDNIQLENDKLYMLKLARYVAGRGMSYTYTYFIPQSGLSSVSLGRTSSLYPEEARFWGQEDHEWFTINSSGTWIAETNSGWIMVAKESLDQEDLDEYGKDPSYFDKHIGQPGSTLYISALANHNGAPRYGNVTVTCGSASLTIPVSQEMYVLPAQLTSPSLGSSSSQITSVPYADLKLRWSRGEGGNCTYSLTLKGKAHGERTYDTILEKDLGSSLSYTIRRNYLEEGYDYLLRLTTEIDGLSSDWETYYFHVNFENELTVNAQYASNQIRVGSNLTVSASATGGSEEYKYGYELIKDGEMISQSEMMTMDYYSFGIATYGIYCIRVTVVDQQTNETAIATTSTITIGSSNYAIAKGSVLTDAGTPINDVCVTIYNITAGGMQVSKVYTLADGEWTWRYAIHGQTYRYVFSKDGFTFLGGSVLSNTIVSNENDLGTIIAKDNNECQTTLIGGTINSSSGKGVKGIRIRLYNNEGSLYDECITSDDGSWNIVVLSNGQRYFAEIDTSSIDIAENSHDFIPSVGANEIYQYSLWNVIVSEQQEDNSKISFQMMNTNKTPTNSILVGENVLFDVFADGIEKVRLCVDEKAYEEYSLINGKISFARQFTLGGSRLITFQCYENGEWGAVAKKQILTVRYLGDLDLPLINSFDTIYVGETATISWKNVTNATMYRIQLFHCVNNQKVVEYTKETPDNQVELPLINKEGTYSIQVMALGSGYNQSEYEMEFCVLNRAYSVSITSPTVKGPYVYGDILYIKAEQTGGGYMTIRVSDANGYEKRYPDDGEPLYTDAVVEIQHPVENTSSYTITAYVYLTDEFIGYDQAVAVSDTFAAFVNGPIVHSKYVEANGYTWVSQSHSRYVVVDTNSAVSEIDIIDNGQPIREHFIDYQEDNYHHIYNVDMGAVLSPQKHTIKVIAREIIEDEIANTTSTEFIIYVVETVTNGEVLYPNKANVTLYSSPYKGSKKGTVSGGEYFDRLTVIGNTEEWYRIRTVDGLEAFVNKNDVTTTIPTGGNDSILLLTPADNSQFGTQDKIQFKWKYSIDGNNKTEYTLNTSFVHMVNVSDEEKSETFNFEGNATSGTVDMSELEEGTYECFVANQMSFKTPSGSNGTKTIKSNTIMITVGSLSLEECYRTWWLQNVKPVIESTARDAFHLSMSFDQGYWLQSNTFTVDILTPPGLANAYILNAYELSQDMLNMNWSFRQNDNNYYVIYRDSNELDKLTRIAIISMLEQDEEDGKVSAPLSALPGIKMDSESILAKAKDMVMRRDESIAAITQSAEELYNALQIYINAKKLYTGNFEETDAEKAMDEVLSIFWSVFKAYVEDALATSDAKVVLQAYVNEYVSALQKASDIYIDYLEEAFFGHNDVSFDSRQKTVAWQVINEFKAFRNNESKLETIAINAFLSNSGYTWEEIKNESADLWSWFGEKMTPQAAYDLLIKTLRNALKEWLKEEFEDNPNLSKYVSKVTELVDDVLIKVTIEDGKFYTSFDVDAFEEKLLEITSYDIAENIVKTIYQDFITGGIWRTAIKTGIKAKDAEWLYGDLSHEYKEDMSAISKLFKSCWKFGKGLPEYVFHISQWIEAQKGRGAYDTYSNLMKATIDTNLRIWIDSGLLVYGNNSASMNSLTIEKMEHLRQSMVSMLKAELRIIEYHDKMNYYDVHLKGGFTKAYSDFSWSSLDNTRIRIEQYKNNIMNVPAAYKQIISNMNSN